MDPAEYDALGEKARVLEISGEELDRLNAETGRRSRVLTAYVDKDLSLKPLGNCGACGYGEVGVNAVPATMSAVVFCGLCNQPRKVYSNIGEPESWQ
jgi:hypothetical protein